MLNQLDCAWDVDKTLATEEKKLVIIRFGRDQNLECMKMDSILEKVEYTISNFAVIYTVDIDQVPEFNILYELYDDCTIMFFYRGRHMKIDLGTGNNNKINWALDNKQEFIDIVETIYRGAIKGKGLVISPYDYSYLNNHMKEELQLMLYTTINCIKLIDNKK